MVYNFSEIEKKWQQRWKDDKTYKVTENKDKKKFYVLNMFPYPSGAGLHVGHPLGYIASDIYARYKRQQGFNVLNPMGYDAYGLPAEQYAIQTGQHPAITTAANIKRYREQLDKIGFSFDWDREVQTCDPAYYKWTQWAFIKMFGSYYDNTLAKAQPISKLIEHLSAHGTEELNAAQSEEIKLTADEWNAMNETAQQQTLMNYRIAYLGETMVNWCAELGTVLANDEVVDGLSVRGGFPVVQRKMRQWCLRVSAYAQRLLEGLDNLDWTDSLKDTQRNWIGRSEGTEIEFKVNKEQVTGKNINSKTTVTYSLLPIHSLPSITVFTTRADTMYGVTFMVLAPESDYVAQVTTKEQRQAVDEYLAATKKRTERERIADRHVSGVFTGSYAENPLTGENVPIWVSDYVLAGYGTGAIMAVPAHDSRDYAFARHFNLPIVPLIEGADVSEQSFDAKEGIVCNSPKNTPPSNSPHNGGEPNPQYDFYKTAAPEIYGQLKEFAKENRANPTEAESIIWNFLKGKGLGESFRRQHIIGEYIADFVNLAHKLVIEIDGGYHFTQDQHALDVYRTQVIESKFGFNVIKFTNEEVIANTADVLSKIKSKLHHSPLMGGAGGGLILNGLTVSKAIAATKAYVTAHGIGRVKVNYRLRDAIFSRQRYWGEPFPVYYKDGTPYMIPEDCLPLELPEISDYKPTDTGEPPLGHAEKWAWDTTSNTVVDKSLVDNKTIFPLELNTMPGFAGSSAYYLRYMDPKDDKALVSKDADEYWRNVDLYVGGTEHATGHLIYSRFWNKFLFDYGVSCEEEPFKKLINQGMIQGRSNFVYRVNDGAKSDGPTFVSLNLKDKYKDVTPIHVDVNIARNDVLDIDAFRAWRPEYNDAKFVLEDGKYICGWAVEKMSKSMFNVVNPDMIVENYGADTLRLYEMFLGPVEQSKPWDTNGIDGCHRFLKKLWSLYYGDGRTSNSEQLIVNNEPATKEQLKSVHKLIKKITSDIESFSYNTAVSAFMICVNELERHNCHNRKLLTDLVVLLAPFTPHISEELWHAMGNQGSVCDAAWPAWNEEYLTESEAQLTISFNGKARFQMSFPVEATNEEIEKAVLADERTAKYINGGNVIKVIVVPKKIVNIVVK